MGNARSTLLCTLALILLPAMSPAAPREPLDHPNVVLILADNLGWGDLSFHGNTVVHTPGLSRLSAEGARIDRFYVSAASAPSRAALLTGRDFLLTGTTADVDGAGTLHEAEVTMADALKAIGYRTGYFGKWQHGANFPHHPQGQGFEEFTGRCEANWETSRDLEMQFGAELRATQGPATEIITQAACAFITQRAAEPFFAFVAYPAPASSDSAPADLVEAYLQRGCEPALARTYASIEDLDRQVERLRQHLDTLGLAKNTIVTFLSDGGPCGRDGRFNGSLYGGAGSLHEGGLRVPWLIAWPGVIEAGLVLDEMSLHSDVFPTIAQFTGAKLPTDRWVDGVNIAPLLMFGMLDRWPNRELNFNSAWIPGHDLTQARIAARTERWCAIKDPAWRRVPWQEGTEQWELYDLLADPFQNYNVADAYPFVLARLKSDSGHWFRQITTFGAEPIPVEIGHAGWPVVRLQAEAAILPESLPYPGDAMEALTQWDNPKFKVTWPAEVLEDGEAQVRVEVRYVTGAPASLALTWEDQTLEIKVEPASGWRSVELGSLRLKAGSGTFTLRAVHPAEGLEIREVRLLTVTSPR